MVLLEIRWSEGKVFKFADFSVQPSSVADDMMVAKKGGGTSIFHDEANGWWKTLVKIDEKNRFFVAKLLGVVDDRCRDYKNFWS